MREQGDFDRDFLHIKFCELHAAFAASGQPAARGCDAEQAERPGEYDPHPGNLHLVFG